MFFISTFCFLIFNLWKLHRSCVEHKVLRVILESLAYVLSFFLLLNVWPTGTNRMPYVVVRGWFKPNIHNRIHARQSYDWLFVYFHFLSNYQLLKMYLFNLSIYYLQNIIQNHRWGKYYIKAIKSAHSRENYSPSTTLYRIILFWEHSMHKRRVSQISAYFWTSLLHVRPFVDDFCLTTKNFITVLLQTCWWQYFLIELQHLNFFSLEKHPFLSQAMIRLYRFSLLRMTAHWLSVVKRFRQRWSYLLYFLNLFYSVAHQVHF